MIKKIQSIKITTKTFVLTAVIGSLLIVSMLIINTLLYTKRTISETDEAVSAVSSFYLEAMADRRAKTISNLINNNFDQMDKAVAVIEEEAPATQKELRDMIGRIQSLLSLKRFAVVDEDNIVYTQYTTFTGGSRYTFLSDKELEKRIISIVSTYGSSKQLCLTIPTRDLSIMGKSFKACFVQIEILDLVDLLAFDDQGRTYFGLYSKNGKNLSGTELGPFVSTQDIFEAVKGTLPDNVWEVNRDHFAKGIGGSMTFTANGIEETLSYVPVEGTDWEMAVLIRENVIRDQIKDISEQGLSTSRKQILFTLVSALLLAAVLMFELGQLSKDRLEEEKEASRTFRNMASTDSMTGVRNKHAYFESETLINKQIREKVISGLAVVVCDINGLKYVNDTQGHAAGDRLIKDACALICEYFTHGAVFRIGGDEFVVLLQGKGYDTMADVLEAFDRRVEKNVREGGVVVSTGCAVLIQDDRELSDVFERADHMMYERKKQLKEMGAPTR